MQINGFQKLTLLDYPEHIACTIFTGGCNFRCPFCHNADLVLNLSSQPKIDVDVVINILKKRKGILEGVCISGGEPTMQKDLGLFIQQVKELGFLIKLDTNGTRPDLIKSFVQDQLIDYIAMDIKNSKLNYFVSSGIPNIYLSEIEESIKFLLSNALPYEFRTTVVAEHHNSKTFTEIAQWVKGANSYYLQTYQDSPSLITQGLHPASKDEMLNYRNILNQTVSLVELRGID